MQGRTNVAGASNGAQDSFGGRLVMPLGVTDPTIVQDSLEREWQRVPTAVSA